MPAQLIERTMTAWELEGDGRTIVGRCVPYGVPTLVADPPDPEPYLECWARGAFRTATRDPARVLLVWNHDAQGMPLGRATELRETDQGLEGQFRLGTTGAAEDALALVRDGLARGLSIHASVHPANTRRRPDGVLERTKATLRHVALCVQPAYEDAQVTAIRSGRASYLDEVRATQAALRATVRPERAS